MAANDDLGDVASDLERVSERLADLALDRLRAATDPDDPAAQEAEALERRITRARRSVEKAAGLLRSLPGSLEDP